MMSDTRDPNDIFRQDGAEALRREWDERVAAAEAREEREKANGHWDETNPPPIGEPGEEATRKGALLSEAEFLAAWKPPDWLVDDLLQRGYCYTLTGNTSHGKTVVALLLAYCLAKGHGFAGKECLDGTVVVFAGENADNVRTQWMALRKFYGVPDDERLKVVFYSRRFSIGKAKAEIERELGLIDDLVLIIVDSLQAFFFGDNENDNTQMLTAALEIRDLADALPTQPAALIIAHPVKNAARDQLLPRGGSSITNELDGNLTLWREGALTELHWHGKFRGPPFEPIQFELVVAEPKGMTDSKGRQLKVTVAQAVGPLREAEIHSEEKRRMKLALEAIERNPMISGAELGFAMGGQSKASGNRMKGDLLKRRLVKRKGEGLQLTDAGKEWILA